MSRGEAWSPTPSPPASRPPSTSDPPDEDQDQGSPQELGASPVARRGRAELEGVARAIHLRHEPKRDTERLTFRLDLFDESGNRVAAVPVVLRGLAVAGMLSEDEEVRVAGKWRRGTLHASSITNVTTGAEVRREAFAGIAIDFVRHHRIATVFGLIIAAVMVAMAVTIITTIREFPDIGPGPPDVEPPDIEELDPEELVPDPAPSVEEQSAEVEP